VVYRTDLGQYKSSDGAAYQHLAWSPPYLVAIKTTDDTSLVSTTLKDDAHLFFNVPVNSKWILTSNVFYYADTTADMKVGWSGPAGATLMWNLGGMNAGATDPNGGMYSGANTIVGTDIAGGAGAPSPTVIMRPSGLLTVAGTSGKLQFRWAQNTSTVNGVNTLAGSWMKLERVG
ncbi:MAG: hypothetical protein JWO67_5404, partial [Streptosporangiaceae bacterium]|nr:hypothetical protein [Streptosporangiaceae bacterium]